MPEYKLYYFPFKGLGEAPRMALTAAGVPFENVGMAGEQWAEHKSKTPFGQMPVLEVDGKMLSQALSIGRYVGDLHGFQPKDAWQRAKADEMAGAWTDQGREMSSINNQPNEEAKQEKVQKVIAEWVIPRLQIYENHYAASSSGFTTDEPCWADCYIYCFLKMNQHFFGVDLGKYPKITAFCEKVENLPKLKEFVQARKDIPWAPITFVKK